MKKDQTQVRIKFLKFQIDPEKRYDGICWKTNIKRFVIPSKSFLPLLVENR